MNYQHNRFKNPLGWVSVVVASFLITACGGGGSEPTPPPPPVAVTPTPLPPPVVVVPTPTPPPVVVTPTPTPPPVVVTPTPPPPPVVVTPTPPPPPVVVTPQPPPPPVVVTPQPPPVGSPVIALFAGSLGGWGNIDGIGSAARFNFPHGVAADSVGNVYVADTFNHTIRKITPAGVVTALAGTDGVEGSDDGIGTAASFKRPTGIAVDSTGNVYVTESGQENPLFSVRGNNIIRKITPAGVVTTLAGTAGVTGRADGIGAAASFYNPQGIAIDNMGNLYVADGGNRIIRKITPAGVVTTLAVTAGVGGGTNGIGVAANFYNLRGIAVDSIGNLYVVDEGSFTIHKITSAGVVTTLAGTVGGYGSDDGIGAAARFKRPNGIAIDSAGNLYVADTGNYKIRKVTPGGVVTTLAGAAVTGDGALVGADGSGAAARFSSPMGVATDNAGNVYVADCFSIRTVTSAGVVSTLAGAQSAAGSADGSGPEARFFTPGRMAADSAGNVYVADYNNHTVRKITPAGLVSTLAGKAGVVGSTNGSGAAASFNNPGAVAVDSAGNVYVLDGNGTIRKITPAGLVSPLAGSPGVYGSADGSGTTASFRANGGMATDSAGNVYVADSGNHTVRKITPAGSVSTLAGTAGVVGSADGLGAAASFNTPYDVALDGAGNVYVADLNNYTIRKITPAGLVSTLAGKAGVVGSANGSGAAASFNYPKGVAVDGAGNVYVSDGSTIRKITPAGVVSTLVGVHGRVGFAAGALPGGLGYPVGLVVSGSSLYITMGNGVAVVTNLP